MKILPDGTVTIGSVPAGTKSWGWAIFGGRVLLMTDQGLFATEGEGLRHVKPEPGMAVPLIDGQDMWLKAFGLKA